MRAYARSLRIDLSFQGFEEELRDLPGGYGPPTGALVIAWVGPTLAGCVALRRWSAQECEMKRLYVRPRFRGRGVGAGLLRRIVLSARRLGYRRMLLDTLPGMDRARAMYEKMGFVRIPPYRANPVPGARFLAISLRTGGTESRRSSLRTGEDDRTG
jgi:carbonic anhydrase